jgi:FMN reductase (NADPH)/FMN reductase [NAD(P)H]
MMACSDALIAAQTAVIAAESLGIGSCYIGDVLEQAETHAALFDLPNHTLPIALLCFGRPGGPHRTVGRHTRNVVQTDRYRRLSVPELRDESAELEREFAPHGLKAGSDNYPQVVYERKFSADYAREMNRSAAVWLERWQTPGTPPQG